MGMALQGAACWGALWQQVVRLGVWRRSPSWLARPQKSLALVVLLLVLLVAAVPQAGKSKLQPTTLTSSMWARTLLLPLGRQQLTSPAGCGVWSKTCRASALLQWLPSPQGRLARLHWVLVPLAWAAGVRMEVLVGLLVLLSAAVALAVAEPRASRALHCMPTQCTAWTQIPHRPAPPVTTTPPPPLVPVLLPAGPEPLSDSTAAQPGLLLPLLPLAVVWSQQGGPWALLVLQQASSPGSQ